MEKIDFQIAYDHIWFDHPLTVITKLDDRVINVDVSGHVSTNINKTLKITPGRHRLSVEISNKNESNNSVDSQGNVLNNTVIRFTHFSLDGINLMGMITTDSAVCKFLIDNNLNQRLNKITEFGYNGTWYFDFETPLYDWLLEKLF